MNYKIYINGREYIDNFTMDNEFAEATEMLIPIPLATDESTTITSEDTDLKLEYEGWTCNVRFIMPNKDVNIIITTRSTMAFDPDFKPMFFNPINMEMMNMMNNAPANPLSTKPAKGKFCPECGMPHSLNDTHCSACGYKFED